MKVRKVVAAILIVLFVIGGCWIALSMEKPVYHWGGIFGTLILGMMLSNVFLGEEPIEFFEDFRQWKRAKLSSFFMIGTCISGVGFAIEFVKMIIETIPKK